MAEPERAKATTHELPRNHPLQGRGSLGLWLAFLLGPIGWMLALNVGYMRLEGACAARETLTLHLITVVSLLLVVVGAIDSWRRWRRLGRTWPDEGPGPEARARFMAAIGLTANLLFGAIVIGIWVSLVILDPCLQAG